MVIGSAVNWYLVSAKSRMLAISFIVGIIKNLPTSKLYRQGMDRCWFHIRLKHLMILPQALRIPAYAHRSL